MKLEKFSELLNQQAGQIHKIDKSIKSLIINSGWLVLSGLGTSLINTVQSVVVARHLGVTNFGYLAIIVASTNFVFQFADCRTWEAIIKFIPNKESRDDLQGVASLFFLFLAIDIVSGLVAFIIIIAFKESLATYIGHNSSLASLMVLYASAFPFIQTSMGASVGILRIYNRFDLISIKSFLISVFQFLLIVPILYLGKGIHGVVSVFVISEVLGAIVSILLVMKIINRGVGIVFANGLRIRKPIEEIVSFLKQSWLSGTIKGIQTRVDVLLLGVIASPAAVGMYRIALDFASFFSKIGSPVQSAILPIMVEEDHEGESKRVNKLAVNTTITLALLLIFPVLLTILFSDSIVAKLAGPEYRGAGVCLSVLVVGTAINTILVWARPLLVSRTLINTGNFVAIMSLFVEVILFLLLVPKYQSAGAAIATSAMYIFSSTASAILAVKAFNIKNVAFRLK